MQATLGIMQQEAYDVEVVEIEKIAKGWIKEYSPTNRELPEDQKPFEYWETLEVMISNMNPASWDVIVSIVNNTIDEYIIANVAAGPLETFIANSGNKNLDKIEREALENPKFAHALQGVWQNLTPDDVWQKIVEIIKKTGGEVGTL
jgi:hypothetical protein